MKEHIPAEPCFRECTPGLSPASSRPCFVHLTSDQHLTNAERRHNEPSPHKRLQKRRQARLEAGNRSCVHFIALILVKFFVSVRPATMLAAKTNIASYSQYNRPCSFFERIDPPSDTPMHPRFQKQRSVHVSRTHRLSIDLSRCASK